MKPRNFKDMLRVARRLKARIPDRALRHWALESYKRDGTQWKLISYLAFDRV